MNKKETDKTLRDDCSTFTKNICNHYSLTVRNKFDTPQERFERCTPNDKYENFVTAHLEASECIPTKPKDKYRVL